MHDERIEAFYSGRAWRKCRASFIREKSGLCELCLKKGLIEPATQVHHIEHLTPENLDDPKIALNYDNLMALCDQCHKEQHQTTRWRCEPNGHVLL